MDNIFDFNSSEEKLVKKADELRIPLSAGFELTPFCNFACDMCYIRRAKENEVEIQPISFWLDLAQQMKDKGTLFILLTGGEPLLYPKFKELYIELFKMGFVVSVNTNATLVDNDIVKLFSQYRPRRINITLYGTYNETYESLCHIKNGYDKCIKGLSLLMKNSINLRLNLTVVRKNQKDFTKLLEFANVHNLHTMTASYISIYSTSDKDSREIQESRNNPLQAAANSLLFEMYDQKDCFEEFKVRNQNYLKNNLIPEFNGVELSCRAGKSNCWINWKGELLACTDLQEPSISLLETPFEFAWEKLKVAVDELPTHTECKDCKLKPLCDVCYANATNEKKHCGSLNYLCQMAEEKARILLSL